MGAKIVKVVGLCNFFEDFLGFTMKSMSTVLLRVGRTMTTNASSTTIRSSTSPLSAASRRNMLPRPRAKATGFWFVNSDRILQKNLGPMIAQGAEAIVYYSEGAPTVTRLL